MVKFRMKRKNLVSNEQGKNKKFLKINKNKRTKYKTVTREIQKTQILLPKHGLE